MSWPNVPLTLGLFCFIAFCPASRYWGICPANYIRVVSVILCQPYWRNYYLSTPKMMLSWAVWFKFLFNKIIGTTCLFTLTSFRKQSGSWKVLEICELCAVSSDLQKMYSVNKLISDFALFLAVCAPIIFWWILINEQLTTNSTFGTVDSICFIISMNSRKLN